MLEEGEAVYLSVAALSSNGAARRSRRPAALTHRLTYFSVLSHVSQIDINDPAVDAVGAAEEAAWTAAVQRAATAEATAVEVSG